MEIVSSRRAVIASALGTGALAMTSSEAAAAVDDVPTNPTSQFFLQVDGIQGDSTHGLHPKWIDVLSWSFGATTSISPTNTGNGPAKSKPNDFTFLARMGSQSPKLHNALVRGIKINAATLVARRIGADPFKYLQVVIENLYVTSYAVVPSDGDGFPLEAVRMDFARITHTFIAQKPDGSAAPPVTMSWNYLTDSAT